MCFHLQAAGKEVGNPEAAKPKAIEFVFQLLLFGFAALVGRIYLQPHYVGSICSKMYIPYRQSTKRTTRFKWLRFLRTIHKQKVFIS